MQLLLRTEVCLEIINEKRKPNGHVKYKVSTGGKRENFDKDQIGCGTSLIPSVSFNHVMNKKTKTRKDLSPSPSRIIIIATKRIFPKVLGCGRIRLYSLSIVPPQPPSRLIILKCQKVWPTYQLSILVLSRCQVHIYVCVCVGI
jgi:hypothetical protein